MTFEEWFNEKYKDDPSAEYPDFGKSEIQEAWEAGLHEGRHQERTE